MELDKACNNLNNVEQIDSELSREQHIESELNNEESVASTIDSFVEVSKEYKGKNTDSIELVVDNETNEIYANILQIQYNSKLEFPSVGSEKLIYVDLSENSLWRFDKEKLQYICVGRDYTQLETISGGNA